VRVDAYLSFEGRCEEAIEFYRQALGAKVEMMMRMKDNPEPSPECATPPGMEDKVMHASIRVGETMIMMSDGMMQGGPATFGNLALSILTKDEAESKRIFDALAAGGTVTMPLGRTFWTPCFGMVTDRFGLGWMINQDAPPPAG
jgi:PhnB protein